MAAAFRPEGSWPQALQTGIFNARNKVEIMRDQIVRICPLCGDENLSWVQHCTGCQESLEGAATRRRSRMVRIPRSMWLGLILCGAAFALLWTISDLAKSGMGFNGPKTLHVIWHKFYSSMGNETIVGEVKNQSVRT